jgi:hypothetical protein
MIITIEVTAAIDAAGTTQKFYLSTDEFITSGTGTPAHTAFEPRLLDAGSIGVHVFSDGKTAGKTTLETGEIIIANMDGGLDNWLEYSFDGRQVIIRKGEADAEYPAGFTTLLNATAESIEADHEKIIIRLRDQLYIFDKPLSQNIYGGTNVLPNGIDGTPDDLKDQRKPRIFGQVKNFAPPSVNTSKLIYQANDGVGSHINAVYDRGLILTQGPLYADQASMENNAPAAGQYRVWEAGGCFRLGSVPAGQVTADVTEIVSSYSTADIMALIAIKAGFSGSNLSVSDINALKAINNSPVGIAVRDETALEALDAVAESIGAYYYIDALGKLRMGQLTEPGTPVLTFHDYEIIKIERRPSKDVDIPAWRVTVKYSHNETVQKTDIAGGVDDARRAWLAQPYRTSSASDATIKNQWLLARDMEYNGRLIDQTAAANEATRKLNLYKVKRDIYEITIPLELFNQSLMDTVAIDYHRFNLAGGVPFRVIGYTLDTVGRTATLTLWG